ncbi:cell wall-binding repeat-containing protein [Clostridium niameyense]|uniref:cell wall-binding repeat-containing protein n=1 Tax=Clostridium niameyense TaxID=1622073 RepID=UPI00067ECCFF|nr:cell wall-binding repeat-containing protein [Clostridium niameyense]
MKKQTTKTLVSSTVVGLVLATFIPAGNVKAHNDYVKRFVGADRYETAANVANSNWKLGETKNIILVSGEGYADALSASLLAQKLNAPILLTRRDELNKSTYDTINKLGAKNIYILGSEGVVSNNIKTFLEKQGKRTVRLGGKDRFETNLAVVNELVNNHGVSPKEVLVVNGNRYIADALTAAPVAAKEGKVLLLVGEDISSVHIAKKFVETHNSRVTVIGNKVTVSEHIYNKLGATRRVKGGKDRFETNRLVLDAFKMYNSRVYIANGQTNHLVDSLVASALAGKYKSPIVLVSNVEETDNKVVNYIYNTLKVDNKSNVSAIGSETILSNELVEKIDKVIKLKDSNEVENDKENKLEKTYLDVVKEDGKTSIDEDPNQPGIQVLLNNKEDVKFKLVEKGNKTVAVKEVNDNSIDLGNASVVNKQVVGETVTLTAIKEGKSTITITCGSEKIKIDVVVKNKEKTQVHEDSNKENHKSEQKPKDSNGQPKEKDEKGHESEDEKPAVDPVVKPQPIAKVLLADGSVVGAVEGSEKIIVPTGKKYKVTVEGKVKYVKANGELSDREEDSAVLAGKEIIGLINGKQYKVEEIAQQ